MIVPTPFGDIGSSDALAGAGAIGSLVGGIMAANGATEAGQATGQGYLANAHSAAITAANTWRSLAMKDIAERYRVNQIEGQQKAGYGAAGVSAASGTPLDVMSDTEGQAQWQALQRFYAGKESGDAAAQQTAYDLKMSKAATDAGSRAAFSDILGGVTGALTSVAKLPL